MRPSCLGSQASQARKRNLWFDPFLWYRKALNLLLVALILYYPASELLTVGAYLSIIARPLGFVLAALSFRALCLALVAPRGQR